MKKLQLIVWAILVVGCVKTEKVDRVFHNANVISFQEGVKPTDAFAVSNGKIMEIGPERQIMNKYQADEFIDLKKQVVIPGFHDAHNHFLALAKKSANVIQARGEQNQLIEVLNKHFAESSSPAYVINWNAEWKQPQTIKADNEVGLRISDGSAMIVSPGLFRAVFGQSVREWKTVGKDSMKLALDYLQNASPDSNAKQLLELFRNANRLGYTGVHLFNASVSDISMIQEFEERGELTIRVNAILEGNENNWGWLDKTGGYVSEMVRVKSMSNYIDGGMQSRSAALKKAYSDSTDYYGPVPVIPDELRKRASLFKNLGFQLVLHAIGDSAAAVAAYFMSDALKTVNDYRWRLEHVQLIEESDLEMMRLNSIVPSVQPNNILGDLLFLEDRLGERSSEGYSFSKLLAQNKTLAIGSSYPVGPLEPMENIKALTLSDRTNSLTVREALLSMTLHGAIAGFQDSLSGSLEVGKCADFIVTNLNPLKLNESTFSDFSVGETYVNGVRVFPQN